MGPMHTSVNPLDSDHGGLLVMPEIDGRLSLKRPEFSIEIRLSLRERLTLLSWCLILAKVREEQHVT